MGNERWNRHMEIASDTDTAAPQSLIISAADVGANPLNLYQLFTTQ